MLLAGLGKPFSAAAVKRAAVLARQATEDLNPSVAVLTIAKMHGSSLGLQHPGLMPTKKERDAQVALVDTAITSLKKLGVQADGQVAVTRKFLRTVVGVARTRQVRYVVMDEPDGGAVRRFLEGDPARFIRPRLNGDTLLEMVPSSSPIGRPASA